MKTIAKIKGIEWDPEKQEVYSNSIATIDNIDTKLGWYYISCVHCGKKVKPQSGSFWCAKCQTETNVSIPRYKIKIEVLDATDKTTFVIFDRDAEKILNKSAKDLVENQEIDIGEDMPKNLKNLLQRRYIFQLRLNEFNLKDGFENYTVAKIFDEHLHDTKVEYLCNNSSGSETLEQSTQESSSLSSLIINTDDAHEGQKYASLNNLLGEKQTMPEIPIINSAATIEDVETDNDDIPINQLYKRRNATKHNKFKKQKR